MVEVTLGRILNYRVGPRTQRSKECIIRFENVDSVSEASKLIGKKVTWKDAQMSSEIVGKIIALHGKNGLVRARFRRGVPGHALGTDVRLVG
jgi:large subunit ribosomal protein L35Ae